MSIQKKELINYVLSKINECRNVSPNGRVSFEAFSIEKWGKVLAINIDFKDDIHKVDKMNIVRRAISDNSHGSKITYKSFNKSISIIMEEYRNKKNKKYRLYTHIQKDIDFGFKYIDVLHGRILFLSRDHNYDRSEIQKRISDYELLAPTRNFKPISVSTQSISPNHAYFEAMHSLDLFRGVMNFSLQYAHYSLFDSHAGLRSINRIAMGPVHTIHRPGGKLALKEFWYETEFTNFTSKQNVADYQKKILFSKDIIKKINIKTDMSSCLEDIFIRYTKALDNRNHQRIIVHLWSLLECVTNTSASKGYELTMKRASALYPSDRKGVYVVLNSIRHLRNSYVHSYASDQHNMGLIYILKHVVEDHVRFLLSRFDVFQDLKEYADFLDYLRTKESLVRKREILDLAINWAGY